MASLAGCFRLTWRLDPVSSFQGLSTIAESDCRLPHANMIGPDLYQTPGCSLTARSASSAVVTLITSLRPFAPFIRTAQTMRVVLVCFVVSIGFLLSRTSLCGAYTCAITGLSIFQIHCSNWVLLE